MGARTAARPAIVRKTGNLSITTYRTAFVQGKQADLLDPILRDWDGLKPFGMAGVEDYVTLDVLEPSRGRPNAQPYQANCDRCRRLGLSYAVYPWVHFYPDWAEKESGFTPYTSLEDGKKCRQPSGWAPATKRLTERFYTTLAKSLRKQVDAVYVADCSEYGELGYPCGYTQWLRPDPNAGKAWWCGDSFACADFRKAILLKYGTLARINLAWKTSFRDPGEIVYPPLQLLKSNPDPTKLDPEQRRRVLDFIYWYQDAAAWRMREFIRIAQAAFPDKPCEVKLGHGDESAILGQSCSSACQLLRTVPRLAIRSTHAATSYFHVKRVSTPVHFFRFKDFLTEPPGSVKPERMAERIFTDACAGVTAYFDYPQNPPAAGAAFTENIGLLDGTAAICDVALLFPEADHYLRIDQPYPKGLLECANAIRDVADFDVVDERLVAAGALANYRLLVIVGDPMLEEATWSEVQNRVVGKCLRVIQVATSQGKADPDQMILVNGLRKPSLQRTGGGEEAIRVAGKPDGNEVVTAIQKAYAALLQKRGLLESQVTLLTARDQLWAGLFENRILVFNPTDTERPIPTGGRLAGRRIKEIRRGR